MTVATVFTTVVCIVNVWLYLTIKILAPIEKLAYWLMSNILLKLASTLISLNLNLIVMDQYSFPAYVLIYVVNLLVFRYVKNKLEKQSEGQSEV